MVEKKGKQGGEQWQKEDRGWAMMVGEEEWDQAPRKWEGEVSKGIFQFWPARGEHLRASHLLLGSLTDSSAAFLQIATRVPLSMGTDTLSMVINRTVLIYTSRNLARNNHRCQVLPSIFKC